MVLHLCGWVLASGAPWLVLIILFGGHSCIAASAGGAPISVEVKPGCTWGAEATVSTAHKLKFLHGGGLVAATVAHLDVIYIRWWWWWWTWCMKKKVLIIFAMASNRRLSPLLNGLNGLVVLRIKSCLPGNYLVWLLLPYKPSLHTAWWAAAWLMP